MIENRTEQKTAMADVFLKRAQAKEIIAKVKEFERDRIEIDKQKVLVDKISQLGNLLETITVDIERSVTETKWKCIWDEEEINFIKKKIAQLIKQM